ncbi:uncharacterized protein Z518_03863 [Rhinocladiella mackenziei CBS 650.93]|uniref:Rhinocladiella mackenziei CBS 650.93 unplaced genomic scaffold supercont1.3, whole genome shotgun sequence n=1 Tax=Rhinocladiella mackenziei CBS 650.93 TaxID=1442369 RepID=A0A0D2J9U5_9EURO|nr:uncharacterized protein Z518_03863 [Rhinocladiella mackenziei CBS 650.93]KIX05890.1 hypothetical protein Z518_03863 [Rhinocladiella mackenziei CBS 650.93]
MKGSTSPFTGATRAAQSINIGPRAHSKELHFLYFPAIEHCNDTIKQIRSPLPEPEFRPGLVRIFAAKRTSSAIIEIGFYRISDQKRPQKNSFEKYHEISFGIGGLRAFDIVKSLLGHSLRGRSNSETSDECPTVFVHEKFAAVVMTIGLVHMWIDNMPMPYDYLTSLLEGSWERATKVFLDSLRSPTPYCWLDFFLYGNQLTPVPDPHGQCDDTSMLPLTGKNGRSSRDMMPESCTRTPGLRSSPLNETREKPSPDQSQVSSSVQASGIVEHPSNDSQQLSMLIQPAESSSESDLPSSLFAHPDVEEAQHHLLSGDATDAQTWKANTLVLPIHNKVMVKKDADTSVGPIRMIASIAAKRKAAIERNYESICLSDLRLWWFGMPATDAEISNPDICWCKQCFLFGPSAEDRVCFGTGDGYVEAWTDTPEPKTFSLSASACSCTTLPFFSETVVEFDFYKSDPRKLRDNPEKRKYLLHCRDSHIFIHKDSKFKRIEDRSAQLHSDVFGKRLLQLPSFGHQRRSSAPENSIVRLGEHSRPAEKADFSNPGSSNFTFARPESDPSQSDVSVTPKPAILSDEICWCRDFCWVTSIPGASRDQARDSLGRRFGTEIGHRVFFASAEGNVEVWTDLEKPKNAFTGAEKTICKMAPRHMSTVVKYFSKADKLTKSISKRVYLLNCREPPKWPLSFGGSRASGESATTGVKGDPVRIDFVPPQKEGFVFGGGSPATVNDTKKETKLNSIDSNLLHPPQSGHQRRSSAPEALESKIEPKTVSAAKRHYLKNGKVAIVRIPPGDLEHPCI